MIFSFKSKKNLFKDLLKDPEIKDLLHKTIQEQSTNVIESENIQKVITDTVSDSIEQQINAMEINVEPYVEAAIDEYDIHDTISHVFRQNDINEMISSEIESAAQEYDFDESIEASVERFNFDSYIKDAIETAIEEYDFDRHIEDAIENFDYEDKVISVLNDLESSDQMITHALTEVFSEDMSEFKDAVLTAMLNVLREKRKPRY